MSEISSQVSGTPHEWLSARSCDGSFSHRQLIDTQPNVAECRAQATLVILTEISALGCKVIIRARFCARWLTNDARCDDVTKNAAFEHFDKVGGAESLFGLSREP